MIRTKGEAGTGNVVEAVRHQRTMLREIAALTTARPEQLVTIAKELGAPVELAREVAAVGKLPVVNFAAGGIATPSDAALMMQLGVDGVFVGSGIFKSEDPAPRARAIVEATTHFNDPDVLAKVSRGLGEPMAGLDIKELGEEGLLQVRGW
jgi:pyridoxal 5'-phosphate synthase pdxS subunit